MTSGFYMKLTNNELSLIQDSDFLLTKVKIISKIFRLLESTENHLRKIINETTFKFPLGTKIKYGKISKGETYLNLPYLIQNHRLPLKTTNRQTLKTTHPQPLSRGEFQFACPLSRGANLAGMSQNIL